LDFKFGFKIGLRLFGFLQRIWFKGFNGYWTFSWFFKGLDTWFKVGFGFKV
jgi:hypothetical protein